MSTTIAQLPETLTINGNPVKISEIPELTTYNESLRAFLAKQEKDKVYSQIESLRNQLSQLKDVKVVENPVASPHPQATPVDFEGMFNKMLERVDARIEMAVDKAISPLREDNNFIKQSSIADYRMKLISENQDDCIHELVVGNTRAELDAALESSKQLLQQYRSKGTPAPVIPEKPIVPPATSESTPAPIVENPEASKVETPENPKMNLPEAPKVALNDNKDLENIGGLSISDFEKKREELKKGIDKLLNS